MTMSLSIRQRYERLDQRRAVLLDRAEEFAELSIPSLLPSDGMYETSELPVPFSAATNRGVSRLASRLLSALVPLNGLPFFNIDLDDSEPVQGQDPTEEQKVLARLERRIMRKLSTTNFRSSLYVALQHLPVLGNCVVYVNDNYNFTIFRLDQFVICRRPDGEWHEVIIRQQVDKASLPQVLIDAGFRNDPDEQKRYDYGYDKDDAIFTRVVSNHMGGCEVQREYKGRVFERGTHDVCPYIPTRWTLVTGENYGRGLIEDNLGDIRAIEVMAEALLDAIAASAEYRFGVNPAGLTEIHDLQESVNGAFVPAAEQDVFPIQLGNQAQVQATQASVTLKEQTLGQVFLSFSSVQRQGERVTAAEIRVLANELEQALGGVFSDAAREILIPIVRCVMSKMLEDGTLIPDSDPAAEKMADELKRPDGLLGLRIRTGLESLNREIENEKMAQIMEQASRLPQPAQDALIWPGMLNRWISGVGIEPTGIVKSVEMMAQESQARAQAEMQNAAAQQAIQSGGAIAEQAATAPRSE
jgi:hypothetical protein